MDGNRFAPLGDMCILHPLERRESDFAANVNILKQVAKWTLAISSVNSESAGKNTGAILVDKILFLRLDKGCRSAEFCRCPDLSVTTALTKCLAAWAD